VKLFPVQDIHTATSRRRRYPFCFGFLFFMNSLLRCAHPLTLFIRLVDDLELSRPQAGTVLRSLRFSFFFRFFTLPDLRLDSSIESRRCGLHWLSFFIRFPFTVPWFFFSCFFWLAVLGSLAPFFLALALKTLPRRRTLYLGN
jgi:hypothetical protein